MKYNEYKEQRAALGKVTGAFSFAAYALTYKTKELLSVLAVLLVAWIATLILNPGIAAAIKNSVVGLFK